MDTSTFESKVDQVNKLLEELASMTEKGGLYIEDMDCSGGVYALSKIEENAGNVRIQACMWTPTNLSKKTGYFRD